MRAYLSLLLSSLLLASPAAAQTIATSAGPERVAVSVYRDPYRPSQQAMNLRWLNGFAFVNEVRQVSIPAGDAEIRFEGVAGGIIPQSAIVTGLPDGVIEKNHDAYLLSPASLLDRSLGKRVHLRRTSLATGKVTEQEAVIRAGADGAVVLQTAVGFEALRCTGLPETIVYDQVPQGLSARPTLSVRTRSTRALSATVTLSYLATGFDWQANYVATLSPSEDRLDLFAWVTLANGDETSFVNASTQAIAGRLNRSQTQRPPKPAGSGISLQCWEQGTTSDIEEIEDQREEIVVSAMRREAGLALNAPAPPPPPPAAKAAQKVTQEELGDLKLYRVPEPVTVASNSQKQVALLDRQGIRTEVSYRAFIPAAASDTRIMPLRVLKMRNRARDGLGLPLPLGGVALFAAGYERPVLIGESAISDKALDEDVEVEFPAPPGVSARMLKVVTRGKTQEFQVRIGSDRNHPIRFDAEFIVPPGSRLEAPGKLGRRNGRPLWSSTVPANGTVVLRYRVISD
jgi:hypothetical protein